MKSQDRLPAPEEFELEDALAFLVPRGFPTFDEFRKNPDKYRERKTELFEAIDRSSVIDRNDLGRQKVYWRYGKEAFTLGKLERVCADHGYSISDVEILPCRIKNAMSGRDEILVRVFPKMELKLMGAKLPNL